MSTVNGVSGPCAQSDKPMSAQLDNNCDRVGCLNIATMKPVAQLRELSSDQPLESFFGVKVCSRCATDSVAESLISSAKQKNIFENIFRIQSRGKQVDWNCSGVVWVRIN